jgi:hypothetical protein
MATSKNTGDTVTNTDVNPNVKGDANTAKQRYSALSKIWANPNAGSVSCSRTQTYTSGEKQPKLDTSVSNPFDAAGVPAPAKGDVIRASHIDAAKDVINTIKSTSASGLSGSTGYPADIAAVTNPIDKSAINNLITTLSAITSVYDAYNGYFDGGDLCSRSCQVACQTACQTSCQGCNTSQCHNQKCGAH